MTDQQTARTVIITGGNGGIGRAIAAGFVREKARVILIGRAVPTLQETARDLGPDVSWRAADVSQREPVAAAIESIVGEVGRIDVLVNNAGVMRRTTVHTPLDEAERLFDEVLDSNLKGSYLVSLAVIPHLRRPGGRIINISSIAASTGGGRAGYVAYAAAKAGTHGLAYALARELSAEGITVNVVAPGFIAHTGITETFTDEHVRSIIADTPLGRVGHVDDVTAAVLYLASPAASFVTGQVLNINGGRIFGR